LSYASPEITDYGALVELTATQPLGEADGLDLMSGGNGRPTHTISTPCVNGGSDRDSDARGGSDSGSGGSDSSCTSQDGSDSD
jgi:hypothetical protein